MNLDEFKQHAVVLFCFFYHSETDPSSDGHFNLILIQYKEPHINPSKQCPFTKEACTLKIA